MKYILVICLLFSATLIAQSFVDQEIEYLKHNPEIKITFPSSERISVSHSDAGIRVFNRGDSPLRGKETPRIIFNWIQDTALYSYRYYFWQEVPAYIGYPRPVVGDIDNNHRVEIYGWKKEYGTPRSEVWCYEQDENKLFKPVYKYSENTIHHYNIYDIDRDGNQELHLMAVHFDSGWGGYVHDQTFYKKASDSTLPDQFYFDYNIHRGEGSYIQLNNFTFGDFNNDDTTDAVFFNFSPQQIRIVKFNESELTFDSILAYPTWQTHWGYHEYIEGFTIGDFDQDQKTDIIYSSEHGNVYVLENESGDTYSLNWSGRTGIWNSLVNFKSNDIDGNGKPEFWICGMSFIQNVSRAICFESTGDNTYEPVIELEFPGMLTLTNMSGLSIDADNDGKEEIMVSIGNAIVLLKFTGKPDDQSYEIYYSHIFDSATDGVTMYKFPGEQYPSIIPGMFKFLNGDTRNFTQVYNHHLVTGVETETSFLPDEFILFNNYPNPFNPSTNIRFSIPASSRIKIRVYNSLGEEVSTIIDQQFEKGVHTVIWHGTDYNNNTVSAGVYFVTMEGYSGNSEFRKTIKALLIK